MGHYIMGVSLIWLLIILVTKRFEISVFGVMFYLLTAKLPKAPLTMITKEKAVGLEIEKVSVKF